MRIQFGVFAAFALHQTRANAAPVQSSLTPAGREADQIASLFWAMTAGLILTWLGMIALSVHAIRARKDVDREQQAKRLIWVGAVSPAIVLAGLLMYGLSLLPAMIAPAPEGSLRISVSGEQWWWRVHYEPPGREPFDVANEIHLPVGQPVEFLLTSNNVIHSFWIPSLGGKIDLIPGRVNRLVLHPSVPGSYRGMCAEFCGKGHAKMTFEAIVQPPSEFEQWLVSQSSPARVETRP
jgi:cytochrome c oxidase subunit 2